MRLGFSDVAAAGMDVDMAQLYLLASHPPARQTASSGDVTYVATRRAVHPTIENDHEELP